MSSYNNVRLFGYIQAFSRNRIALKGLCRWGISSFGYFLYKFLCARGSQQSVKITICGIFIDSASNQDYFPKKWLLMLSWGYAKSLKRHQKT